MSLGENIRYLRIRKGYSQDFIAEKLGYKSYTTIQKWESGISEPPIKKLKELSELFNVDMNDVANGDFQQSLYIPKKKGVTINILGSVAAGAPIEAIENIIDTEEITEDMARTGEFFGLQIKGDSMEPNMRQGDVVIVRKQSDAESGNVVIAIVNGSDATCKRLIKYADGISLVAFNPKYEPMYFSNKEIVEKPVKIIGRVVENRQKY